MQSKLIRYFVFLDPHASHELPNVFRCVTFVPRDFLSVEGHQWVSSFLQEKGLTPVALATELLIVKQIRVKNAARSALALPGCGNDRARDRYPESVSGAKSRGRAMSAIDEAWAHGSWAHGSEVE